MTIKQGGVFGRNPTFNDVGLNNLVATGDISADEFNGRRASLSDSVVVSKSSAADVFLQMSNTAAAFYLTQSGNGSTYILNYGNQKMYFGMNGTEDFHLDTNGNINMTQGGGNLIVASGKGIDFSATAGTGTSELFSDYEEGAWAPTFTAEWTTPPTVTSAQYTKIGRQVAVTLLAIDGIVTVGGGIGGLPFASNAAQGAGAYGGNSDTTESLQGTVGQAASSITNIPARVLTGNTWQITATYFT